MKNWQNTTDFLREIPLPEKSRTYVPVSHAIFIDEIMHVIIIENIICPELNFICLPSLKKIIPFSKSILSVKLIS